MLKKISRPAAFICTAALLFSLCGCSDTSWAVKVGDITMPSGVYIYNIMTYSYYAEYYVNYYYSSNTSALSDPWNQTLGTTSDGESVSAEDWAKSYALQSTESYAIIEQLCAKQGVTLTSDEKSTAETEANDDYTSTNYYSLNGVSVSSLARVFEDQTLRDKLFDSYYGTGGTKEVSSSDLKSYFNKNYVRIKHIVIKTVDDSGYSLSNDEIAAAKTKAEKVLKLAKSGSDFDKLMTKYSEDKDSSGNINEADGYVFSESSASNSNYDDTFTEKAFDMKIGDIEMVSTSYGYDIMLKLKLDPDGSYFDKNKSTILKYMKSDDFSTILTDAISSADFDVNTATTKKYKPSSLQAATSTAASKTSSSSGSSSGSTSSSGISSALDITSSLS